MSAYLVSAAQIDLIVSFAIEHNIYAVLDGSNSDNPVPVTVDNAEQFGKMLWSENVKSLVARYGSKTEEYFNNPSKAVEGYKFTRYVEINFKGLIGAANNYDYQSCEHNEWRKSNSRDFIMICISKAADKLAGQTPWGIDSDTVSQFATKVQTVSVMTTPGKRRGPGRPKGSKNKPKTFYVYG